VTARLRDAKFFWESDRKVSLQSRLGRLHTVLFHKKLGSYRDKAERIEQLARWMADDVFGRPREAGHAATAGRLCKADLTSDMVFEFPELQGRMGGIYAREEGQPAEVWKAIYHHYLPISVEADAPPARAQLGEAAVAWAAVSLADKLDTVAGLTRAGERPTGSRDPFGLRRQMHGIARVLMDLPELAGIDREVGVGTLLNRAAAQLDAAGDWDSDAAVAFALDRVRYAATLGEALASADYVQESTPERVEVKRALFEELDRFAAPDAILASSTSGIPASSFTEGLAGRQRCLVAHPINPPFVTPLVEICPAPWTDSAVVERTHALMLAVGQAPIRLRREIQGFVANRMQGALIGAALRMVKDGVVDAEDIDVAIRHGIGLRFEELRQRLRLYLALGGAVEATPPADDPAAPGGRLLERDFVDPDEDPLYRDLQVGTPPNASSSNTTPKDRTEQQR